MKTIAVDIGGTPHDVTTEQPQFHVYAKWNGERYFVLASGNGDLFDVLDSNNNFFEKDRERGKKFWELEKCSKECYDAYTSFLRLKSRTPFILAQRSFRNDL